MEYHIVVSYQNPIKRQNTKKKQYFFTHVSDKQRDQHTRHQSQKGHKISPSRPWALVSGGWDNSVWTPGAWLLWDGY